MGWKSTIDITRAEAKRLIIQKLINLDPMSDVELADMVQKLGYGDMVQELGYGEEAELEYYGYNFIVTDE